MEALAIIAYKQPVTRGQVEYIRGVNSDSAVNRLAERGLIEECGHLDAPGRPILYGTTDTFLKNFGFSSIKELPQIDDIESLDKSLNIVLLSRLIDQIAY